MHLTVYSSMQGAFCCMQSLGVCSSWAGGVSPPRRSVGSGFAVWGRPGRFPSSGASMPKRSLRLCLWASVARRTGQGRGRARGKGCKGCAGADGWAAAMLAGPGPPRRNLARPPHPESPGVPCGTPRLPYPHIHFAPPLKKYKKVLASCHTFSIH